MALASSLKRFVNRARNPRTNRGASLELPSLGTRRKLKMPGLSATVREQITAVRKIAGEKAAALIRHETNPIVAGMVSGWPQNFAADRALALGFRGESSFDEIIRIYIEDELGGRIPVLS